MTSLSTFVYWEGLILTGSLCALVMWKIMTGEIALDKLFDGGMLNSSGAYPKRASLWEVHPIYKIRGVSAGRLQFRRLGAAGAVEARRSKCALRFYRAVLPTGRSTR